MKKILLTLITCLTASNALASDKYGLPSYDSATCLANNIYFESKGQSNAGMIAVGLVTMNRVKDKRFPNTVCEVVYQGPVRESWKTRQHTDLSEDERVYYPKKHRCQFSWYCDGKADKVYDKKVYAQTYAIALRVLTGRYNGLVEGATHYHATYVNPSWNKEKTYIGQIGDHIFYRWD